MLLNYAKLCKRQTLFCQRLQIKLMLRYLTAGVSVQKFLQHVTQKTVDSIDALLPKADFVSLHCPGGKENKHLIYARRLNLMRPTAYLINTARGEIVDEQMLANALRLNTIAGAGLDVYEREPVVTPELIKCENAVLTTALRQRDS